MEENKKIKKENPDTFRKKLEDKIPKNVRQIGNISQNTKIYIEEFVLNYLKRLQKDVQLKGEKFSAVLIGEKHIAPKTNYFFIVGAIKIEVDIKKTGGALADETKKQITRTIESYFGKENSTLCQIGWSSEVSVENKIQGEYENFHRENFGSGNTLFLSFCEDGEELFYIYENGKLKQQGGYYVYFEKNEGMQQYVEDNQTSRCIEMENLNRGKSESYRMILANKKEDIQHRNLITFLYTASTFLVMVVIVLGVTLMNHNDKLKDMQAVIASLSKDVINGSSQQEEFVSGTGLVTDVQVMSQYDGQAQTTVSQEGAEITNQTVESSQTNQNTQLNENNQTSENAQPNENNQTSENAQLNEANQTLQNDNLNNTDMDLQENSTQTISEISEQEYSAKEQEFLENNFRRYEIKEGDTLIGICKKLYGSQEYLDKICQYNHIDNSDEIVVGQKIWVP